MIETPTEIVLKHWPEQIKRLTDKQSKTVSPLYLAFFDNRGLEAGRRVAKRKEEND